PDRGLELGPLELFFVEVVIQQDDVDRSVEFCTPELVHLVFPEGDVLRGQLLQACQILLATLDAVLLPFVKSVNRDEDEWNSPRRSSRVDCRVCLSDLLLQQRFKRFLPDFGFRRWHALGALEEVLRSLGVPLEIVERHAQVNHEVGAAYLPWTWNPIFEFL